MDEQVLIDWINSFNFPSCLLCCSFEQVREGVVICDILSQILKCNIPTIRTIQSRSDCISNLQQAVDQLKQLEQTSYQIKQMSGEQLYEVSLSMQNTKSLIFFVKYIKQLNLMVSSNMIQIQEKGSSSFNSAITKNKFATKNKFNMDLETPYDTQNNTIVNTPNDSNRVVQQQLPNYFTKAIQEVSPKSLQSIVNLNFQNAINKRENSESLKSNQSYQLKDQTKQNLIDHSLVRPKQDKQYISPFKQPQQQIRIIKDATITQSQPFLEEKDEEQENQRVEL